MMRRSVYIYSSMLVLFFQTVFSQIQLDTVIIPSYKKLPAAAAETDEYVASRYYYYPNLNAYYDIKAEKYIYERNGVWVTEGTMPRNYRGYSMYNMDRRRIRDYDGDRPYEQLSEHRKQYPPNYFSGRQRKYEIEKSAGTLDDIGK